MNEENLKKSTIENDLHAELSGVFEEYHEESAWYNGMIDDIEYIPEGYSKTNISWKIKEDTLTISLIDPAAEKDKWDIRCLSLDMLFDNSNPPTFIGGPPQDLLAEVQTVVVDEGFWSLTGPAPQTAHPTFENLTLPSSIKRISPASSSLFENIDINENNPNLSIKNGIIYDKEGTTLISYPPQKKDESFTIPDGVINVNNDAFRYNLYLKTLTLSEGVKTASVDSESLEKITVSKSVSDLRVSSRKNDKHIDVVIDENSPYYSIGNNGEIYRENNTIFAGFPFGHETDHIESLVMPNSVTTIDKEIPMPGTFDEIVLGDNVQEIGAWAFNNVNVDKFVMNNNIKNIAHGAFNHSHISSVHIDSIESWLKIDFEVPSSNPLFHYCPDLYIAEKLATDIVLPKNITEIKNCAFAGASFKSIAIHDGVTSIGKFAFKRSYVEEFVLASGVSKEIEEQLRKEYPNIKIKRQEPELSKSEISDFENFYNKLVEQLETKQDEIKVTLGDVDLTCKHHVFDDSISIRASIGNGEFVELATFSPEGFDIKDPDTFRDAVVSSTLDNHQQSLDNQDFEK